MVCERRVAPSEHRSVGRFAGRGHWPDPVPPSGSAGNATVEAFGATAGALAACYEAPARGGVPAAPVR
jgi:hypothetical protein